MDLIGRKLLFFALALVIPLLAIAQTQEVKRDTSWVVGGFGRVDSALRVTTTTGKAETAYEWGVLSILNNHSTKGENVAIYGQSNAYGTGPTWGMVSEVADDVGRPGAMVGHEVTMNMTGPDSGLRLGLDVVLGDGKFWRGKGPSTVVEGTIGVRVAGQDSSNAIKTWGLGYEAKNFRVGGLHLQGAVSPRRLPDGIIFSEGYGSLINTYGAKYQSLFRVSSSSPVFAHGPGGGHVGCLQVEIDGNPFCLPVLGWR